jgi:hypothetical protein
MCKNADTIFAVNEGARFNCTHFHPKKCSKQIMEINRECDERRSRVNLVYRLRYVLDHRGSIPGRISGENFFLFATSSRPALGSTHPTIQCIKWG